MTSAWESYAWQLFWLGPFVLFAMRHLLARYLCRFHLSAMLAALRNSPAFSRLLVRGIDHLRFSSRAGLLLLIGHALVRANERVCQGKLSAADVARFPALLKGLALTHLGLFIVNVVWFLAWVVVLALYPPAVTSRLPFLMLATPFALFAFSRGLMVYITHYHLHELIDAIGLSQAFRSSSSVELERIVFMGRSQLIFYIGLALFFRRLRIGNRKLDEYRLDVLPPRVQFLIVMIVLCVSIGLVWLFVAVALIKLNVIGLR